MSQEKKKKDEEKNQAHHGPPILTERDLHICASMVQWVRTVRSERQRGNRSKYDENWLPTEIDIRKSRLFWRLRSGKEPLPVAPPTCYSCPWYEVVEDDRDHWAYELYVDAGIAYIAQCPYNIVELHNSSGLPKVVEYNEVRFKVWQGSSRYEGKIKTGWWIKRSK